MKDRCIRQATQAVILLLLLSHLAGQCHAGPLKSIFAFPNFANGAIPVSNLIFESGMIYGNTQYGGTGCTELTSGCGTLFQVNPVTGAETVLHSFLFSPDGGFPEAGPVYVNGAFYGATQQGGQTYQGAIYAYDPATKAETVVFNFDGPNGVNPNAASLATHNGILFGATAQGGTDTHGVIYKFDTRTGKLSVLYNFTVGPNGYQPNSGVIYHDGYLYGTTLSGGRNTKKFPCQYGCGTLFQYNLASGLYTVLYSFTDRRTGGFTFQDPLIYQNGELFGVTGAGGAIHKPNCVHISGCGIVYKFDLATNTLNVLYRFTGGRDGYFPMGGLVYVQGNLYGTTQQGGAANRGTVFKVNVSTGVKTLLHSFSLTGAKDGTQPGGGLTYYDGKLYGTTVSGGDISQCDNYGCGTIFEISP